MTAATQPTDPRPASPVGGEALVTDHPYLPAETVRQRAELARRIKEGGLGTIADILFTYALSQPGQGSFAGSLWAIAEQVKSMSSALSAPSVTKSPEWWVERARREGDHIISAGHVFGLDDLLKAGNELCFAAETSGGTAGPDEGLQDAIKRWATIRKNFQPDAPSVTGEAVANDRVDEIANQAFSDGVWVACGALQVGDHIAENLIANAFDASQYARFYAAPVSAHEGVGVWAVGSWLSAALDDPSVCEEMKADIREWFDGGGSVRNALSPTALEQGSGAFPAKKPVIPTEREDGAVVVGHTPKCWGLTSYSDEMAHCYCPKPSEADTLATLLDNVVISQSLSKELRQNALDEARSYLYDRRQRQAAQTSDAQVGMETPEGVGMNPEKALEERCARMEAGERVVRKVACDHCHRMTVVPSTEVQS